MDPSNIERLNDVETPVVGLCSLRHTGANCTSGSIGWRNLPEKLQSISESIFENQ